MCATNQLEPVFDADLLEPGMHLTCVRHCEIDAATYNAADAVVMHASDHLEPNHYLIGDEPATVPELTSGWTHPEEDDVDLVWADLPDFRAIYGEPFERDPDDVTVFNNNIGLGVQFAAVGKRVYDLAVEAGVGTKLDPESFAQPHHP